MEEQLDISKDMLLAFIRSAKLTWEEHKTMESHLLLLHTQAKELHKKKPETEKKKLDKKE